MAAVSGQLTTFNMPNYLGELFHLTPSETPFLSMIGGLNGGKAIQDTQWSWQTDDNAAASQDVKLEGDDATFSGRDRAMVSNVLQIHHEGVEVTYTKSMAVNMLANAAKTGTSQSALFSIQGMQPVQNEMSHQLALKIKKVARDVEFSFLQGAFANPNVIGDERQTRGMLAAITTNEVAASAALFDPDMLDELLLDMYNAGAPFMNPVLFANGFQKQRISKAYGYAPESRNVGGVNIMQIETDFCLLGIVLDRHLPADDIIVADVSVCRPVHGLIPEKGLFFTEPLAKTGSANKMQLYGEIGLEYGPEQWHGKITDLATSV